MRRLPRQLGLRLASFRPRAGLALPAWQAAVAVPIGLAAGFCTSVIGVGAAAVQVPALTLGLGLPQVVASSTGLAATLFGILAGAAKYMDSDSVQLGVAGVLAPAAMLSSIAGASASTHMSDRSLKVVWAVLALAIAATSIKSARDVLSRDDAGQTAATSIGAAAVPLVRRVSEALGLAGRANRTARKGDGSAKRAPASSWLERTWAKVAVEMSTMRAEVAARHMAAGLVVGFMNGLLGVSGTPIVMSYLSLFTDCTQHQVLGTALVAVLPAIAIASVTHWRMGNVHPKLCACLMAGSVGGGVAGANVSLELPEAHLKLIFAGAMTVIGCSILRSTMLCV